MMIAIPVTIVSVMIPITSVGGATMTHIFARGRSMRAVSYRVINPNPASVYLLSQAGMKSQSYQTSKGPKLTTPFNSLMQRVASSTADILIKPKPRERSDYRAERKFQEVSRQQYNLRSLFGHKRL